MATTGNFITFGSTCPADPCFPCGCNMLEYAAVIYGPFFYPLYLDPAITDPAKVQVMPYLTKTIHIDWLPAGNTQHFIYDCTITVNPYTNDVTIVDSGDPTGYATMLYLIQDQFPGIAYAADRIDVNVLGSFAGDLTGYVSLSGPFDRTSVQTAIDELLAQLTWDDVKAYLKQFTGDPSIDPSGAQICSICVNWQNHFQHGNSLVIDAAPPWSDGSGNPTLLGAFFQSPLPQAALNQNFFPIFDTNNHMIGPYLNPIGAKKLQVGLSSGVFGASEAGNLLISIPDLSIQTAPVFGLTDSFFSFLASKLLAVNGGNYCDNATIQVFSGGRPISTASAASNVSLPPNTEIPRLPFSWLDTFTWQNIIHEYDRGAC
jgi:hypothetical protein